MHQDVLQLSFFWYLVRTSKKKFSFLFYINEELNLKSHIQNTIFLPSKYSIATFLSVEGIFVFNLAQLLSFPHNYP